MMVFLIWVFITTSYCWGGPEFLKVCEETKNNSQTQNSYSKQVKWLKFLFKTNSCKKIKSSIETITSISNILPNSSEKYSLSNYPLKPKEFTSFKNPALQYNENWKKDHVFFNDLSLFKEFKNFNHIYFGDSENDKRNICRFLKDVPSIKKISTIAQVFSKSIVDCLMENKIEIYLIGDTYFEELMPELKNSIYGIENFRDEITLLQHLRRLKYLGLKKINSTSSLKELKNIRNLSNLYLNVKNVSNIESLEMLRDLEFLTLNCYENHFFISSSSTFNDLKCKNGAIENINFISQLKFLKGLDLALNDIEDIRPALELSNLNFLSFRNNKIKSIPLTVQNSQLKFLDLSNNLIMDIKSLEKTTKLELLDISNNNIENINSISKLQNLRFLSLGENPIKEIKNNIPSKNLKVLLLNGSRPESNRSTWNFSREIIDQSTYETNESLWVEKMLKGDSFLIDIPRANARLSKDLPENLHTFEQLEILSLNNYAFNSRPEFSSLKKLKYLDLSFSAFKGGEKILFPENLIFLSLRKNTVFNELKNIALKKLAFLDIGENKIENNFINLSLPKLAYMKLDHNSLTEVPDFSGSPDLQHLEMNKNRLREFNIANLNKLQFLDIANNEIAEIPKLIYFPNLIELYISGNKISNLSGIESESLFLWLAGNPVDINDSTKCPHDSKNTSVQKFCRLE